MSIAVGQTAPDFTLLNQEKKDVKLSDYAGKKNVVLVWYPLDWSPTCTNEHVCFVNDMKAFETLDAEVLGVSVDSVWSHKAFAEKMGIKYSLLADFHPRGAMSEKYGVYSADKGITGRAIAIVNKAGKVARSKNYDITVVTDLREVAAVLGRVSAATVDVENSRPEKALKHRPKPILGVGVWETASRAARSGAANSQRRRIIIPAAISGTRRKLGRRSE